MKTKDVVCYLCHRPVKPENYCAGCDCYVCTGCGETAVDGRHDPEDHKEDAQ